MGGSGSGTWYGRATKTTTASCRTLDVRLLQRQGIFHRTTTGQITWSERGQQVAAIAWTVQRSANGNTVNGLVLDYTATPFNGAPEAISYSVPIDWTPCNYGNARPWFRCPATGCGRRVALLYLCYRYFVCRHCNDLVYASQREDAADRARERLQALRVRLGGSPNLMTPFPRKPKRMHWRTFTRLRRQAQDDEATHYAKLLDLLQRDDQRLQRIMDKTPRRAGTASRRP